MSDVLNEATEQQKADISQKQRQSLLHKGSDFEPDRDLKETWLPLRKTSPRKWGGIEYPGLFDYRANWDAGWFWITVSLEVAVALAIVTLFFLSGKVGIGPAFAGILLNLLLDGLLAYIHHLSKREYCIQKNKERSFFPEGWKVGINSYAQHALSIEKTYKTNIKVWFWHPFSAGFIWVFALLKILIFLGLYIGSDFYYELVEEQNAGLMAIGLAVLAIIAFIWIAVNHTYRTGYYLAYLWHHGQYGRAFSEYISAISMGAGLNNKQAEQTKKRYQAQSRTRIIDLNNFCNSILQVDVPEFRHFQQSERTTGIVSECLNKGLIEKELDGLHSVKQVQGQRNTWILTCHGLLKDEQLDEMVKIQPTNLAKLAIAYYGHSIQMESVNL